MALLELEINLDLNAIAARFSHADELLTRELGATLDHIGAEMTTYIVTQKLRGGVLNYRTGNLGRAIYYVVKPEGNHLVLRNGADINKAIYARLQELGGTVTPKNAAHLTVPLPDALTPSGVNKFTAREVIANPSAYGFASTFTRNGVIFGKLGQTKTGKQKKVTYTGPASGQSMTSAVPLFALKDSVTIKPAGYLSSSYAERRTWIKDELQGAVNRIAQRFIRG